MTAQRDLIPSEVAADLRCSIRQVQALLQSGELSGYRVGTRWRVPVANVEDFKRRQSNVTPDNLRQMRSAS